MIINHKKYGQLCNRLLYTAHLINCCIETGHTLIDYSLIEYSQYFENVNKNGIFIFKNGGSLVFVKHFLSKLFYRIHSHFPFIPALLQINLIKESAYDINKYFQKIKSKPIWVAEQWGVHVNISLNKNKNIIKEIFIPKEEYLINVNSFISKLELEFDILVGVHLRRGDYKVYENGKYYFTDEQYNTVTIKIQELFPSKTVGFILVSNEKIIQNKFSLPTFIPPNNHLIEDLYILSKCDYIVGPPSSYSSWASFYGNTPLCVIKHIDDDIMLEQFVVFY
jgi:hypothetical protein